MIGIETIKPAVVEFLRKVLDTEDVKIIGVTKVGEEWHVEAEVYEESSFLKSLGLPSRVRDKNVYEVKLNERLEIESYERQGHVLAAE